MPSTGPDSGRWRSSRRGQPSAAASCCACCACSEIALANPAPVDGLRAMVDELVRLPGDRARGGRPCPSSATVGCATSRMSACRTSAPHEPSRRRPTRWSARPWTSGELVQLPRSEGGSPTAASTCRSSAASGCLGCSGPGHPAWPAARRLARGIRLGHGRPAGAAAARRIAAAAPTGAARQVPRPGRLTPPAARRALRAGRAGRQQRRDRRAARASAPARSRSTCRLPTASSACSSRADAIRLVLTQHGDWLAREREARQ